MDGLEVNGGSTCATSKTSVLRQTFVTIAR
jgi:hypothetical protein